MENASTGVGDGAETVAKLFWRAVGARAERVALREKDLGIWRSISWAEYGEAAKRVGLGLVALGLEMGDRVCVISHNNAEWYFTDMGVLGAAGVTVGIYPTDAPQQIEYVVNDCGARFIFAEDEEQLDKILAVRGRLPTLEKIIVYDMEGLRSFQDPMVTSFDDLIEAGRAFAEANPGLWEERLEARGPDDLAILIYTSGTTGPPKGAMISHRNILFQLENGRSLADFREGDVQLSFLPLSHIAERLAGAFFQIMYGTVVNFAESPETVPENIREVQPTVMFAVPRVWEKFYSAITISVREGTWLERRAYRLALGIGYRTLDYRLEGRPVPTGLALLFRLADFLVLGNVKRMIGLGSARYLITGAAPISPDLIKWYLALGLSMQEIYGQTENTGLATAAPEDAVKIGTVGRATPNTEVRISPEGEILLKGPHVFMGYLNMPERTAETVKDGWLHTGDVGQMDNQGYVRITDRMKDIIITAGGKNITPSEIENQLKFSPYVSDAVVIGDRRKYLTCLIMIDYDNVAQYAQEHDVPFTDFASLTRARQIVELIGAEVEKVNTLFARVETIKKFRLIEQQLDLEDEELTPTMKLKRAFVNKKYKDVIDGMYAEEAAA